MSEIVQSDGVWLFGWSEEYTGAYQQWLTNGKPSNIIRERSGATETVVKRINDCFERSLNGTALDSTSREMQALLESIAALSDNIRLTTGTDSRAPSFTIGKVGDTSNSNEAARIRFAGIPLGHEFTSLILALLQTSGRAPKISDEQIAQIKALDALYELELKDSSEWYTTTEIQSFIEMEMRIRLNTKSIGEALKKIGFEFKSKSINGVKLYRYNVSKKPVSERNQR